MPFKGPAGHLLTSIQQWLEKSVEVVTASVLVAEVVLLFVGIIARSVFHSSLIWSDELASILFLWLAMLGSALAVQRSCHMRLTFFVSKLSPRAQAWTETLAVGITAVLLAIVLHPSFDYVEDQGFVETPALGWSGTVRALALPVGFIIAFISCALRLMHHDKRDMLTVGALLAVIASACYLARQC